MRDTVTVTKWMVLGAARENGNYVAKSFKLQYCAEDGTWVDVDVVEDNQINKVVRTLAKPVTATQYRLQMVQGEQNAYTTRIYEFALYGYAKGDDPDGIEDVEDEGLRGWDEDADIYDLSGRKVFDTNRRGIYIQNGRKVIVR